MKHKRVQGCIHSVLVNKDLIIFAEVIIQSKKFGNVFATQSRNLRILGADFLDTWGFKYPHIFENVCNLLPHDSKLIAIYIFLYIIKFCISG
jgi:hypothetical protein